MTIGRGLPALLASPKMPVIAAALSAAIMLPTLWTGRQLDDYPQTLALRGDTSLAGPTGTLSGYFVFSDGDPQRNERLRNIGMYPWWMPNDWKLSFYRPVSVLTHMLDEALWGEAIWVMHLHSVLWYAAGMLMQGLLIRKIFGAHWAAGLAMLCLALNDQPAGAVCWIANRNSMICMTIGMGALLSHIRWRETGMSRYGWLAFVLLFVSLMAKESAAVVGAFMLSWAICFDQGSWFQRFRSLSAYLAMGLVWWVWYRHAGYGMTAGLYADPGDGLAYLEALLSRGPLYAVSAIGLFSGEFILLSDKDLRGGFVFYAWGICILCLALLWPMIRRDRVTQFWLLGTFAALVPACSAFPSDRVTLFICLGMTGVLVRSFQLLIERDEICPNESYWRGEMFVLNGIFLGLGLIGSPIAAQMRTESWFKYADSIRESAMKVEFSGPPPKSVVFVNAPGAIFNWHFWTIRKLEGAPLPENSVMLMTGFRELYISRLDERTLEVNSSMGLLRHPTTRLFRDEANDLHPGDRISVPDCEITVLNIAGQHDGPTRVRFRFSSPLSDKHRDWRIWQRGRYVPWTPPEIGDTVTIPRQVSEKFFYGRGSWFHRIGRYVYGPDLPGELPPIEEETSNGS